MIITLCWNLELFYLSFLKVFCFCQLKRAIKPLDFQVLFKCDDLDWSLCGTQHRQSSHQPRLTFFIQQGIQIIERNSAFIVLLSFGRSKEYFLLVILLF